MLSASEINAYGHQLVLCPQCGGQGRFETLGAEPYMTAKSVCGQCDYASADYYPSRENILRLIKEWSLGLRPPQMELPADGAPVIANYGAGVDSTAMLVHMVEQGIRPDLILFADPGDEKPETYAYLEFFDGWLQGKGFPGITHVAYQPVRAPYSTLEGNCLANETLPSISFRKKSCTLKFKAGVMDAFLLGISRGPNKKPGWEPALNALAQGLKPVKLIGYDNGPLDSCRAVDIEEDKSFRYRYPLRQIKWSREDCILAIHKAGLPVPVKSACFHCASSKPWELYWMGAKHPDLLARALRIEDTARDGKHGLGNVQGLWGQKESWRQWCEQEAIVAPGTYTVIADPQALLQKARALMPPLESNLDFKLPQSIQEAA